MDRFVFVALAVFVGLVLFTSSYPKKPEVLNLENVPTFLGQGMVIDTDRSNPKLRDGGLERVRVQIEAGAKTSQLSWEVVSPMAEVYQKGDLVQLWTLAQRYHDGFINPFPFLCRQPSKVK